MLESLPTRKEIMTEARACERILLPLSAGWRISYSVEWNMRLRTSAGRCVVSTSFGHSGAVNQAKAVIQLHPFCFLDKNPWTTLRHEMAHAFSPTHGHGRMWARQMVRLGIQANIYHNNPHVMATVGRRKTQDIPCKQCGTILRLNATHLKQIREAKHVLFCMKCGMCLFSTYVESHSGASVTSNQTACRGCGKMVDTRASQKIRPENPWAGEGTWGHFHPGCMTSLLKRVVE